MPAACAAFNAERQHDLDVQRLSRDTVLQGQPFQILHDDERLTILLSDLMDRADVGMVESGSGSRLVAKPFECLRVLRHVVRQEFQRNEATKLRILSLVDDAHPAPAEFLNDAVMRSWDDEAIGGNLKDGTRRWSNSTG